MGTSLNRARQGRNTGAHVKARGKKGPIDGTSFQKISQIFVNTQFSLIFILLFFCHRVNLLKAKICKSLSKIMLKTSSYAHNGKQNSYSKCPSPRSMLMAAVQQISFFEHSLFLLYFGFTQFKCSKNNPREELVLFAPSFVITRQLNNKQ